MSSKESRQEGEFAPPGQRGGRDGKPQHTQLPSKKREDARRYKRTPKTKRDSRKYYHLVCKRNPKCMQRREEYRHNPKKYKRRKTPLREAAMRFVREAAEIVLYDQENPSNREIKQPGDNVGYEATSPSHYRISPDSKGGLPSSHDLPNQHHDEANPATSRVVPDSMKQTLQENLTYKAGRLRTSAALISEIFQNCSPDLVAKSKGVQYSRKSLKPNGMSTWTASGSKGETYTVRVKPVPKNKSVKVIAKMPIQVSCTCDFFRWQGPEHWAKTNDYLYGKPAGSATKPSKKDPSGKHWACKHVLAVLDLVKKHKIAGVQEYTWSGELEPFPGSIFSAEVLACRYAAQKLTPDEFKELRGWWGRGKV